jgi:vacuolar-type H+-ATPase subunit C/Vma6
MWHSERLAVENLKPVLRAAHYQVDRSQPISSLISLRSTRWRWEELLEAVSVAAVIGQIRNSPFARALEYAMERHRQEQRLFYLEVAVDLFYFQELVGLIESQSGTDKDDARQFLGRWIAVQNLLWAYRYRICGGMTAEEIINYTLHRAFAVGLDTLRRVMLGSLLRVEAERLGSHVAPEVSEVQPLSRPSRHANTTRARRASAGTDRDRWASDSNSRRSSGLNISVTLGRPVRMLPPCKAIRTAVLFASLLSDTGH